MSIMYIMKGGEKIKVLFYSTITAIVSIIFLNLNIKNMSEEVVKEDYLQANYNDVIFKEIKNEKQEDVKAKHLKITDKIKEDNYVTEKTPIISEEKNIEEELERERITKESEIQKQKEIEKDNKIAMIKDALNSVYSSLNNELDITKVIEEKNKLDDITKQIDFELSIEIKEQLGSIEQEFLNINNIEEFITNTDILYQEDKSIDDINKLRTEYKDKKIEDFIITNNYPCLNEMVSKLKNIGLLLNDNQAPIINIKDKEIYKDNINLEISDANRYTVFLNNQLFNDKTISENGNYELKVIDEVLNETFVTFTIEKEELNNNIQEEIIENQEIEFKIPMKNYYLTQNYQGQNGHMGIDLSSNNKKEAIYPIKEGEVIFSGKDKNGALVVKIMHKFNNQNIFSTYAHMREIYVTKGQLVTKNDIIGLMGSTGNSTGPHLHLEMTTCDWTYNCNYQKYKNNLLNPWDYLDKKTV